MRFSPARFFDRVFAITALVAAIVLLASAVTLVMTQYSVRQLFSKIEQAEDVARRLADDTNQLTSDLSKAALPAAVSRRAQTMGFVAPTIKNTRLIEVDPKTLEAHRMEAPR